MAAYVSRWTRITHRADVLIRNAPLPVRLQNLLSMVVYRNPPMSSVRVVETLGALEAAGLEAWVMGGWGLDALAGKQSRAHHDLDLIVDQLDIVSVLSVLRGLGYEECYRSESPGPVGDLVLSGDTVVVRDEGMGMVDLHAFAIRDSGQFVTIGSIGELRVKCLTVEQQLLAQKGYRARIPTERRRQRSNVEMARRLAAQSRGRGAQLG